MRIYLLLFVSDFIWAIALHCILVCGTKAGQFTIFFFSLYFRFCFFIEMTNIVFRSVALAPLPNKHFWILMGIV